MNPLFLTTAALMALRAKSTRQKGSRSKLEPLRWIDAGGEQHSVMVKLIGSGAFSRVYIDPKSQMVYSLTAYNDKSKILLAELYSKTNSGQRGDHWLKHLPKIQYLGTYTQDKVVSIITDNPIYGHREVDWEPSDRDWE